MTEVKPIVLCDNKIQSDNNSKSSANGKIDEDFSQGSIGDCALLTTLYSLSKTKEGEQAIEDTLCVISDDAGDILEYEVSFDSIGETYSVTPEELEKAKTDSKRAYSAGDDDVTVLELAFEKCFNESDNPKLRYLVDNYSNSNKTDKLSGVNPASVSYLLTGKTADWFDKRFTSSNIISSPNFIPAADYNVTDIYGKDFKLNEGDYYKTSFTYVNDIPVIKLYDAKTDSSITINSAEFLDKTYNPDAILANDEVKKLFNDFNSNNKDDVLVFATRFGNNVAPNGLKTFEIAGANGETVELYAPHAYSVVDVKDGVVTLVNPHDTSEPVLVQLDSLLAIKNFYVYALNLKEANPPKRELINRAELY